MSAAWLLPGHIADVLPAQARHIEELRRVLLDVARSYGCELVMPPLLEHLDSLLSGTGQALNLKTFKLVDQLSGRTLGIRADITPQVARIDAHLLNREGLTRLCYCGPVLHTRPAGLYATREPLQFGVEIYGHSGLEADLEVLDMALDCLSATHIEGITLDMSDARILKALLAGLAPTSVDMGELTAALASKDAAALALVCAALPAEVAAGLQALLQLYGGLEVLDAAASQLTLWPGVQAALKELRFLAQHVNHTHPEISLSFDLADVGGHAYYSGARFALYVPQSSNAMVRGGRYDEVGAVFGRNRPAVGFSLDLKELAAITPTHQSKAAIRAPWADDASLRAMIRELRSHGETVTCILPGHEHEGQEFNCDRELAWLNGQWTVQLSKDH